MMLLREKNVWLGVLVLCSLPFLLFGCYSFSATSLPSHIKSVKIEDVENLTTHSDLGIELRQGLVELFHKEASGIRIVNELPAATFKLTLKQYTNQADNYNSDATVETYRTVLLVDVVFTDEVKKEVIYEGHNLRAEGSYDVLKNETEDEHGKPRAIEKMQELIVNNALTQW